MSSRAGVGEALAAPDPAHEDAVRALTSYRPRDAEQGRWRRQFLDQLASRPDAARRDGPPAHLTASVLVLDPRASRTLLVHHRTAGLWVQPGGHLERDDTTVRGAALREVTEETGLGPDDLVVQRGGEPFELSRHGFAFGRCTEHLDVVFLAVADPQAPLRVSEESDAVRWWPLDALPDGIAADLPPRLAAAAREQRSQLSGGGSSHEASRDPAR